MRRLKERINKNRNLIGIIILLIILDIFFFFTFLKEKQENISPCTDCNVIFVAFDGLQAEHLNYYGYHLSTTPNLDKLLDESYVFKNAISPSSWTIPTYMSVFTSMYPSEHKLVNKFSDYDPIKKEYVKSNLTLLSPDTVTFAEILKNNGYKTAAFTGDAGFSGAYGYNKGFDEYYDATMFGGLDTSMPKAISWLQQNKNEKFFLVLHGYDSHGQYAPTEGFDYRYVNKSYAGSYTGSTKEQGILREDGLKKGYLNMTEEDILFWRAIYDEKINRVDDKFGEFMEEVKTMGLENNTIIVVFSDHGTEFYEHKTFDHGHTLYGELVDVLFSIHLPNQTKGKSISSFVGTLDTMPTILGILGIKNPVPNQTKGIDLTPTFFGKDLSRNQFSETDYRLYTHKRSVQTKEGWKLIITYPEETKELYNLKSDPQEEINLAEKEKKKTEKLEKYIQQHLAEMNSTGPWNIGCLPVYNDQCKNISNPLGMPISDKIIPYLERPNILLINLDSLRADRMGVYGYDKNLTPFLDSLFQKGVIFDNALAPAPFTFQTDASILTSTYPSQHGLYTGNTPIKKENVNLFFQQKLKEEGYKTAAFVSPSFYNGSGMFVYFDSVEFNPNMRNLNESSEKVINWISENNQQPYFLFWHLFDLHLPYQTPPKEFYTKGYNGIFFNVTYSYPKEYSKLFVSGYMNKSIIWEGQTSKTIEIGSSNFNYTFTQEDIDYLRASYDYGVSTTDKGLELFFKNLTSSGYLNNTIIIISSEHGDDLKEHGYILHSDIYNVVLKVPLLILYPRNIPTRVNESVSLMDIMPTVLDLMNKTPAVKMEGKSLVPLIKGQSLNRTIFSERPPFGEYSAVKNGWKYILRNPNLKDPKNLEYIESTDIGVPNFRFFHKIASYDERYNKGNELYNLLNDPYEQNNLIGKGYPIEKELKSEVTAFKERMIFSKNNLGIDPLKEEDLIVFSYP